MALPKSLQDSVNLIRQLPQIGPRQAVRLTLFLFRNAALRESLAQQLQHLSDRAVLCSECFRVSESSPCALCSDKNRDPGLLAVVEEDTDLEQLEKTGAYSGRYLVLGGRFDPNRGTPTQQRLRVEELRSRIRGEQSVLREVILAMNPTAEGDLLALTLFRELREIGMPLTRLGRGLPVGGEIEYADEETLKGALQHRA